MPRNICLAFTCFWSLFLLTDSVSADWLFILSRLLAIQQPGNTHGIYQYAALWGTLRVGIEQQAALACTYKTANYSFGCPRSSTGCWPVNLVVSEGIDTRWIAEIGAGILAYAFVFFVHPALPSFRTALRVLKRYPRIWLWLAGMSFAYWFFQLAEA